MNAERKEKKKEMFRSKSDELLPLKEHNNLSVSDLRDFLTLFGVRVWAKNGELIACPSKAQLLGGLPQAEENKQNCP